MSFFVRFLILTICSKLINCNADNVVQEAKNVDFNKFYDKLDKHSKIGIKSYLEVPDTDVLLNSDGHANSACKFYNQSIKVVEMLDNWNEKNLINNLNSSFMFGDMTEIINQKAVHKRTSLRRFINGMDQYLYETSLKLSMPIFFRETIDFPSVLECDYLEDKFHAAEMEVIMNYENFSENRVSDHDQLVCAIKGNVTFMMMNQTNIEYLLSHQTNLTKKILKKINGVRVHLSSGDCVYIPQVMTYSLKAEYAWLFSVSWPHVNRIVREEECFDRENRKNTSKIIAHKFVKDIKEDAIFLSKISLIQLFTKYLGSNSKHALNLNEFIEEDEKEVKVKCDQNCKNILFKVFTLLDSNKDNSFDQDDLDNFDEQSLLKINAEIKSEMKIINDKEQAGVENLRGMLKQLKELAENAEAGSEIAKMIEEKTKEWYNSLSFDQKKRLKDDKLSEIVDELLNINKKSPKVEIKKSPKPTEKIVKDKPVEIIAEADADEVNIEIEGGNEENMEFKVPKINVGDGNGLNLSDEQMEEIMRIIEAEDAKDARNEL